MPSPPGALRGAVSVARRITGKGGRPAREEFRTLRLDQTGRVLRTRFSVSARLRPNSLWCRDANGEWAKLADVAETLDAQGIGTRSCSAQIDLSAAEDAATKLTEDGQILRLFVQFTAAAADLPKFSTNIHEGGPSTVQAGTEGLRFIDVRQALADGSLARETAMTVWASFGRFADTQIGPLRSVPIRDASLEPYVDRHGLVSLAVNRPLKPYNAVYVHGLSVNGGIVDLRATLVTRHGEAEAVELMLLGRESAARYSAAAKVSLDVQATRQKFGLRRYKVHARLNLGAVSNEDLSRDEILDAWLRVHVPDRTEPQRVRVGRTRYVTRKLTRPGWQNRGDKTLAITPYYTFKAKNTSFHVELLDTEAFDFLQRHIHRARVPQIGNGQNPVWLVGERPSKAQDNGLHFFRYLRREHPEIDAYYVIAPSSPDRHNLDGLDHVVEYRSKQHFDLALRAERFIGSHHPDFLFPTWLPQFRKAVGGVKVFLQHGVMGTKWMVPNYGKKAPGFDTDLFLVSSEREKEYIVSDFGYAARNVAVTGLSRFDSLFAADVAVRLNQILIIPTWRDWLQHPDQFEESEYFQEWNALLNDPRLRALVERHDAELVFCLHPNMQQFRHHFSGAPARVISPGEVDVQYLIKESAVLLTDYSSVGFDFSFLDKPVHYFQFDRERFLGPRGSHLDLDEELPGQIAFDRAAVLQHLESTLSRGCVPTAETVARSRRFLKYRDKNNSGRIFEAVAAARPAEPRWKKAVDPELIERLFARYRRSRFYFPTMRRVYAIVSKTSMDKNLMVFESGLGKQYADSPRYIYEELVRRGDSRRKVWVYQGKLPAPDPYTKVVKRLSPAYYWYLAKAKYWVNNQNFPYYVRRRKNGVFIQTWHGTPLKKMAHDVGTVFGRDPDYLAHVDAAVRQWTTLLSPSPYATEVFRSAFRFTGGIVQLGYPRNDVLLGSHVQQHSAVIRRRLGISDGKRVVLYAPTFRDDQPTGMGHFRFELPLDLEAFRNRFGDDTVLLLRMHVLVSDAVTIPEGVRDCVYDVSKFPEVQELYLASDVLITDYSSAFFDYAILQRPVIFYAYDLEHYRDTLRGFYLDYNTELPGPVVRTVPELFDALDESRVSDPERERRLRQFVAKYAPRDDGNAAARVVDRLLS
jgi:CDP-glycerol glycerophosphotransferase